MKNKRNILLETTYALIGVIFIFALCWFGALADILINGSQK